MRSFIAIELPKEVKDSLVKIQEQLQASGADVKWIQPNNIHITLKFLGELNDKKVKEIIEILEKIVKNKNSFLIRISSLGAFPKIDYPSVIWVGIDKGDAETKIITKELEEEISKAGIPKEERPFFSHITIARVKSPLNREKLVQKLKNMADISGRKELEFKASKITLFKSTLTPKGPIYEVLKDASLKAI